MRTLSTRDNRRRPRSAKARNRGRSGNPTVQERLWGIRHVDCGVDWGREALGGRYWGDGSAKPGESSWKEAKDTAAVGGWETRSGKRCRCRRMTRRQGGLLCAMQL